MFKNNAADSQKVGLEPWLIYGFKCYFARYFYLKEKYVRRRTSYIVRQINDRFEWVWRCFHTISPQDYYLNSYMEVKLVLNALTGVRLIFCWSYNVHSRVKTITFLFLFFVFCFKMKIFLFKLKFFLLLSSPIIY